MPFRAFVAAALALCNLATAARLRQHFSSGRRVNGMKVKLWTWNSMKEDLREEADNVFNTDAEIVVTCQTEAKVPIYRFASSNWHHISYAQHSGFTGEFNAQYLSVFLRAPAGKPYNILQPPEEAWKLGKTLRGTDKAMGWSRVAGVVNVTTRIHQTSNTGKGGASARMTFQATAERKTTTVMVLCAHLDAFEDSKRLKGLVKMFNDMRPELEVKPEVLEAAPCMLFDSHNPECLQQVKSIGDQARLDEWANAIEVEKDTMADSVIILGDLNYRLQRPHTISGQPFSVTDIDALTSKMISPEGRRNLALADPLNPDGRASAQLVRPVSESGFSFQCNKPFENYPPTYKLFDEQACADLGQVLRRCDTSGVDCKSRAQMLARQCYAKKPKDGKDWEWSLKGKEELQLGWLDRACFRAVDDSSIQHHIMEEEGFAQSKGSDHMPVAVTLLVSNPHSCHVKTSSWPANGRLPSKNILVGRTTLYRCDSGHRLTASSSKSQAALRSLAVGGVPPQEIELRCHDDFQLFSSNRAKIPFSEIQCKRYCGPYKIQPDSGKVRQVGGNYHFMGGTVDFKCQDGYALLGSWSAKCQGDGNWELSSAPPRCALMCPLDSLQISNGVRITSERESNLFDFGLYESDVAFLRGEGLDGVALEGAQFTFGCAESGCTLVGGQTLTCSSARQFKQNLSRLACVCSAEIQPMSVSFGTAIPASEVKQLKLKIIDYSSSGKEKDKSQVKWEYTGRDSRPNESLVIKQGDVEQSYLHLTVCTKRGAHQFFGSTCKVGATSLSPKDCPSCSVGEILRTSGNSLERVKIALPLHITKRYRNADDNPRRSLDAAWQPHAFLSVTIIANTRPRTFGFGSIHHRDSNYLQIPS